MVAMMIVCVGAVQILGLAALGWARMSEGARHHQYAQVFFFLLLAIVAATAAVNAALGSALWPVCSVTCGVMIVGATVSSRREMEAVV